MTTLWRLGPQLETTAPGADTEEIVVARASVKGFQVRPVAYDPGLWKTWRDT